MVDTDTSPKPNPSSEGEYADLNANSEIFLNMMSELRLCKYSLSQILDDCQKTFHLDGFGKSFKFCRLIVVIMQNPEPILVSSAQKVTATVLIFAAYADITSFHEHPFAPLIYSLMKFQPDPGTQGFHLTEMEQQLTMNLIAAGISSPLWQSTMMDLQKFRVSMDGANEVTAKLKQARRFQFGRIILSEQDIPEFLKFDQFKLDDDDLDESRSGDSAGVGINQVEETITTVVEFDSELESEPETKTEGTEAEDVEAEERSAKALGFLKQSLSEILTITNNNILLRELKKNPKLLESFELTPEMFPKLVEKNPEVAVAVLQVRLEPQEIVTGDELMEVLTKIDISIQSMEVVNHLMNAFDLPDDFMNRCISNLMASCLRYVDKYVQCRLARLVCVFLLAIIRQKNVQLTEETAVEISTFCLTFTRMREASNLYRTMKQLQNGDDEVQQVLRASQAIAATVAVAPAAPAAEDKGEDSQAESH